MSTSSRAPGRRSIRLRGYDYAAPGAYFVTISVHDRHALLAHLVRGRLAPTAAGAMVRAAWDALPDRFPGVAIDAFVVMRDHVHGILWLTAPGPPPPGAVRAPLVGARRDPTIDGARRDPTIDGARRAPTIVGARRDPTIGDPAPAGAHEGRPYDTDAILGVRRDPPTLGDVVGAFKSLTTVAYFDGVHTAGWPRVDGRLWHRNYYERILRDDAALGAVRRYIARNPARWVAKHRCRR